MTFQQWWDQTNGRAIDFDGYYGYQCVDLFQDYNNKVVGGRRIAGNAINFWNNYDSNAYEKIVNTPSAVPRGGDVIIWGTQVGQYGHIAICSNTANVDSFVSLDQNWPYSNGTTPAKQVTHNYNGVLGWLRPKKDINFDQAAYDIAQAAAAEAARIAKEAEDARIAQEAAEAAKRAQEEADRIAAEKAEADRIAKEEAERVAAEQKKLAEEQAKLDAELKAKQEAEKKENIMLKGYRTYLSLGLGAVALVAPAFGLPQAISEPLVALCLALAAYFRARA